MIDITDILKWTNVKQLVRMIQRIMLPNDKYVNKSMFERHTRWISIEEELPKENQRVDVWIKAHTDPSGNAIEGRREINQVFKQFASGKWAFQNESCHDCGLYELAYLIEEDLIEFWIPSLVEPVI